MKDTAPEKIVQITLKGGNTGKQWKVKNSREKTKLNPKE